MPGGSAGRQAHADGHGHGHEERGKLASVASSISVSDATHASMIFLSSLQSTLGHYINGKKTENTNI